MARKKTRRQFRELEVLETLIVYQGVCIECHRCGVAFTEDDVRKGNIQKEHLHELGLDGPDMPINCRFSHRVGCHSIVTNGTPATSAGSSKHRIAKANHPNRTEKFVVRKVPLAEPVSIDAGDKCRRCGEFSADCICQPRVARSQWPQKRARA